jgi:hypothetical protein
MVQLGAASLTIASQTGDFTVFDYDACYERLSLAFIEQGINEDWLVENIALTLEEKVRSNNESGIMISEVALDEILLNLLVATGYGEVASTYLRQNNRETSFVPQGIRSWDFEGIRNLLLSTLPLAENQLEVICQECLTALKKLSFKKVSDNFLRELAIHIIHHRNQDSDTDELPPALRRTQFISAQSWLQLTDDDSFKMIEKKILFPLPISDIFPVARLEFRIDSLASYCGSWSPELLLLPAMEEVCQQLLELLQKMRSYIKEQWPRINQPAAHLIMPGFKDFFMKKIKGFKKKQRLEMLEKAKDTMKKYLATKDLDLMLSFR